MRALVTGATGFIGGHLVDVLVERGDTVTALVRSPERARGLAARGVQLIPGDLEDVTALASATANQDVIYHLAGVVAARSEAEFRSVNRDGTARLATAAEAHGTPRFVLISSLAAAGPSTPGHPLRGDVPARPVTAYGRSKLAAEQAVRSGRLDWTILRPPAVYGPGDREMLRVFQAARLGLTPVFGDGSQALSLVFGPDLAAAIAATGAAPAGAGEVFYPCHPEIVTSRALTETVGRALGKSVRVVGLPRWVGRAALTITETAARLAGRATVLNRDKANEFFAAAWTCDPGDLTARTGWRAAHDLAAGATEAAAWYRANGWL